MKTIIKTGLVIAISALSVSVSAAESNGLNSELVEKAMSAGLNQQQAVTAVATGQISQGTSVSQLQQLAN